jgi:hypothetical protein
MRVCIDFKDERDFPGCCLSCHEDADEYGYDMCGGYGEWEDVEVCCLVMRWLETRPTTSVKEG